MPGISLVLGFDAMPTAALLHYRCAAVLVVLLLVGTCASASDSDSSQDGFTAIAAGLSHSCGLRGDGGVECWGADDDGQLGAPGGSFTAIAAGWEYSCGLRADGTIHCWGDRGFKTA